MPKQPSTEETLMDSFRAVERACLSNTIMHLSHCFTGAPAGHAAAVTTFVTCPDGIAQELHARLDATVQAVFAEHKLPRVEAKLV
jgi:hypothetical protein